MKIFLLLIHKIKTSKCSATSAESFVIYKYIYIISLGFGAEGDSNSNDWMLGKVGNLNRLNPKKRSKNYQSKKGGANYYHTNSDRHVYLAFLCTAL